MMNSRFELNELFVVLFLAIPVFIILFFALGHVREKSRENIQVVSSKELQVGECFIDDRPREKWESSPLVERVIEVGDKKYRTEFYWSEANEWVEMHLGLDKSFVKLLNIKKVPCPQESR